MTRALVAVAAATVAFAAAAAQVPAARPLAASPAAADAFPAGAGRDTFVRVCSGCHSPAVAAQQRLSPTAWSGIVEAMAGNGAQGTDAEFAEITAYLAATYPAPPPAPH